MCIYVICQEGSTNQAQSLFSLQGSCVDEYPSRPQTNPEVRAVGAGSASKVRETPKRYESALQVWINHKTYLETITAIWFLT